MSTPLESEKTSKKVYAHIHFGISPGFPSYLKGQYELLCPKAAIAGSDDDDDKVRKASSPTLIDSLRTKCGKIMRKRKSLQVRIRGQVSERMNDNACSFLDNNQSVLLSPIEVKTRHKYDQLKTLTPYSLSNALNIYYLNRRSRFDAA